jgi:hypothetical protein
MKNNQLRIGRTNKPAPLQKNPDKQKYPLLFDI